MTPVEHIQQMTDEEFSQHALSILSRELGLYGYARYLRLCCSRHGDYTAERDQWLGAITIEDIRRELNSKPQNQR